MGGKYSREAIHKRLLEYDPGDVSAQAINDDDELPNWRTLRDNYVGKSKEHISTTGHLKNFVAEDHLQVWQGDDESIEKAVEQAVHEIGEKPTVTNLKPFFRKRDRLPGYDKMINQPDSLYSGTIKELREELEVTEENVRAYSDEDRHVEDTLLYVHDQLCKEAPTRDELLEFLKNQPMFRSFDSYDKAHSQTLNDIFEKYDKRVTLKQRIQFHYPSEIRVCCGV